MRYWRALAYFRDTLVREEWTSLSLDDITQALVCTRRNAQLVIKRLVEEEAIGWKPGVGRGNLPKAILLKSVTARVERYAKRLMKEGKTEEAISLIPAKERDQFIAVFVSQYQTGTGDDHILQVPFYRGTHDLDSIGVSRRSEVHIANHLYAYLVTWDGDTQQFRGDLAHFWEYTEQGVLFYLRKGLRFHDGSPLLAEDIKQHYIRLMNSPHQTKALYQFIDRIVVHDDLRIEFISESLPNLIPKLVSSSAMGIAKSVNDQIVGSGPFMLVEQTEWRTLLKTSPHYHGFRPWIDGVEIWNVGDKAKDFELNSDMVHGVHLQHRSKAGFEEKTQWEPGCIYAQLNPNRHTWMKKRANRKWLQKVIQTLPLPEVTWGEEVAYAEGMTTSPIFEKAVPNGEILSPVSLPKAPIRVVTYQLNVHIAAAEQVHQRLTDLGIDCEITIYEYPEFDSAATLSEADIIVSGEVFDEDTELSWMFWLLCTYSSKVCFATANSEWLKQKVVTALQLPTSAQRLRQLENIETTLINKGLYQPILHIRQDTNVSEKLTTTSLLPNGWIDFTQVVIKPS
ncbi:SgrR family transcriptional regulator [Vibrio sp. SCSIO 43132]|uniref:ABC transporter substrate-binding protein n=1 Tax=Vibrio sp. SCSIO 43132 TaxID=2779363 RepID=UPI001CA8DD77|nr:ABC transporter substrate-binding protein [Vibrio sp. SCSIO 43132]UAB73259.1 SgrR family transcriptional regulator [Vibrio sp. SCSIO 43132]